MAGKQEIPKKTKPDTKAKAPDTKTKAKARVLSLRDIGLEKSHGAKVAPAYARWVHVLHQNGRQGTVGCKGRSDVSCTGRKPWKQKGTGRARAGSAASPLWKGGGVTFGPQKRERTLSLPKKQRRIVLRALISQFLDAGRVTVLNWNAGEQPKTARAKEALREAGLQDKRVTVFVGIGDELTTRSFRNIPGVRVVPFDQPNAISLGTSEAWLVLDKDLDSFKAMVPSCA